MRLSPFPSSSVLLFRPFRPPLFRPPMSILSIASSSLIGVVEYGLCEGGHFEGAAEAVAEIGEGTYA